VQARLRANAPGSGRSLRNKYGALLKGIVRCATCNVGMVHTYTQKDARLYRYYVCVKAHQRGWTQCETRSVSAPELEQAVIADSGRRPESGDAHRGDAALGGIGRRRRPP